jgi:N-acetylmuramoyl-L-alanine amidase
LVARQIKDEFLRQGAQRGIEMSDSTVDAGNSVNDAVRLANGSGAGLAISNHLNAGGGTGFEVYYDDKTSATNKTRAADISRALATHYGLRNRGAKPDTAASVGSLGWTSNTNMPALLIEWGFIDNDGDMGKILADIPGGVKAVLDVICPAVISATSPEITPLPEMIKAPPLRNLIKRGMTGEDVKVVQGVVGASADGIFGPATEKAVKAKQKATGVTADGVVGPKTKAAWGM